MLELTTSMKQFTPLVVFGLCASAAVVQKDLPQLDPECIRYDTCFGDLECEMPQEIPDNW